MSLVDLKRIVEELDDLNVAVINITGGEPLLHRQFDEIIHFIKSKGFQINLFTNGLLLDKHIDIISEHFLNINIGLDSCSEDIHDDFRGKKGAFKKIIENINELKKHKDIFINQVFTLTDQNISEIRNLPKFIKDNNIDNYSINFLIPTGNARQNNFIKDLNLDTYFERKKKRKKYHNTMRCYSGISTLTIKSDKRIIFCVGAHDDFFTMGNLNNNSLKEIWNKPLGYTATHRKTLWKDIVTCKKCKDFEYCQENCPVHSYLFNGDVNTCDPLSFLKTKFELDKINCIG